jgi:hypothetical protein
LKFYILVPRKFSEVFDLPQEDLFDIEEDDEDESNEKNGLKDSHKINRMASNISKKSILPKRDSYWNVPSIY